MNLVTNRYSFNTTDKKCKVLSINKHGTRNDINEYYLNESVLPNVNNEKDLGINVDSSLSWNMHIKYNISKAKQSIGWVKRNVISRDILVMLDIYKTLVRPHLEFCVQLWCPKPCKESWATIMDIESVQREYTRLIDGIGLMTYKERLDRLQLTTLIERRARGDLIEVFKIFRGLCRYGKTLLNFSRSGMNIVIKNNFSCIYNNFEIRVANYWNKLPDNLKMSDSVVDFKKGLEKYKLKYFSRCGNYWELSDEIFNRINDSSRTSYANFMKDNIHIARRRGINIS